MQAGAGIQEGNILVKDHVIIAVARAQRVLRRVDPLRAGIDAHGLQVLGEALDDRFQRGDEDELE
jgi:hypothetical protein